MVGSKKKKTTATTKTAPVGPTWLANLKPGEFLDVQDVAQSWCEAAVIKFTANKVHLHYRGWDAKNNQWVDRDSPRLAPAYTHVRQWRALRKGDRVQIGTVMLGKRTPLWHNATVTQVRPVEQTRQQSQHKKPKQQQRVDDAVPAQVQVQLEGNGEKRWIDPQDDLLCPEATHSVAQVLNGFETRPAPTPSRPSAKETKQLTTKSRARGRAHDDSDDDDCDDSEEEEEEATTGTRAKLTTTTREKAWRESLRLGSLLEVADDNLKYWYDARVVYVRADRVCVRFRGWPWRYDEWLPRTSERLAKPGKHLGDWRAFQSDTDVQIGFRKSATEDSASHWVRGRVVALARAKPLMEVKRVQIQWRKADEPTDEDEDDDEEEEEDQEEEMGMKSEWRDVDDDFLAPCGVPTFPESKSLENPVADGSSGGDTEDGGGGGSTPEDEELDQVDQAGEEEVEEGDKEPEDGAEAEEEEEEEPEIEMVIEDGSEEHSDRSTGGANEERGAAFSPQPPLVVHTASQSERKPPPRTAPAAPTVAAPAQDELNLQQFKRQLKEDIVQTWTSALSKQLTLVDAINWPVATQVPPVQPEQKPTPDQESEPEPEPKPTPKPEPKPEPKPNRPVKRRTRLSRVREHEQQQQQTHHHQQKPPKRQRTSSSRPRATTTWGTMPPFSKSKPAHI